MTPFYEMMANISSKQGDRVTITTAILIGLLTGTIGTSAVTTWIHSKNNKQSEIIENQNATLLQLSSLQAQLQLGDQEIKKQLTSTDLLAVSCSEVWMKDHTDMLCREMFCRLQTREGDGASQTECEEINNIANTFFIIEQCAENNMEIEKCLEVLDARK
jgi:hypothetical protein